MIVLKQERGENVDRWTMRELRETDDISFAIRILNERKRGLTPYSPLGIKIGEAVKTLSLIRQETDNYIKRISRMCDKAVQDDNIAADYTEQECLKDDGETTDLSDCPDEMKIQIIANAEKLERRTDGDI